MTDKHWSYSKSFAMASAIRTLNAKHAFFRPHCPRQYGKVARYNRALQAGWAYRQVFTTNTDRTHALAPWLRSYDTGRRHAPLGSAIRDQPILMNVSAEYS